ncbi:MAG: S8 family peptidase [Acidobacteria bacterium]|nr:S8 family peptidase [Acidobacteriota bacterium]MCA1651161.1 S8 family peptidase [Acidobacteriota bacterium]
MVISAFGSGVLRVSGVVAAVWLLLSQPTTARDGSRENSGCPPGHEKLDRYLHAAVEHSADGDSRVILRVRPGYLASYKELLERHGDRVKEVFTSIDALAVELHGGDAQALAMHPAVESISVDAPVRAASTQESQSSLSGLQGLRETLGVTSSWTGDGIGIAVIDSGLEPTADFADRIGRVYDFTQFTQPADQSLPRDGFGHGTHVTGLAGGDGKLSKSGEFMGMAPKARFVVLRVLDETGAGYTSSVISAIEFAVQKRRTLGIDIINLSLGHPIYEPATSDPLVLAVETAVRAGIVVVVAAGNYGESLESAAAGYAGITSPGNAPSAITIGAFDTRDTVTRTDDRIAPYSSRGPSWYDGYAKPDLVAPGHRLGSAAATGSWLYMTYPTLRLQSIGWDYMRLSGTSMAAGVTSGVIALMLEANRNTNGFGAPGLTPNAVKAVLQYTSIRMRDGSGLPYDPLTQGAGGLNAGAAVELARAIRTTAGDGSFWLDNSRRPDRPASYIAGETWPWQQTIVWGNTILTGPDVLLNHGAWATTVVWGSAKTVVWGSAKTVVWGSTKTVVWGSNVVWDKPQIWASTVVWGSSLLGTTALNQTVVWGSTDSIAPKTVVWGALGNLPQVSAMDPGALTLPR